MIEIQTKMSERAIELLAIDPQGPPKFILDIGKKKERKRKKERQRKRKRM